MRHTQVIVIGGGATGTGILRDLCMRGVSALLVEQGDLASGTSSRFHGLLHSGARYAVSDPDAARECITENAVLKRIGGYCVEETEGWFVLTPEDDPAFEPVWLKACRDCGIPATPVPLGEAKRREPNLHADARAVYRVPDAAVDGFRLVWHNVMSARRYGGDALTYCRVEKIHTENGRATGITVQHLRGGEREEITCDFIINATGSWAGNVAQLAGIDVNVAPDRGTLLAFNHRFTERVINRLRRPTDGDIFVPHGSITIFGTTSVPTDRADDTTPTSDEVLALLQTGKALFPKIEEYRILRAFAGTRPLYSPHHDTGRAATRNFVIIDHAEQGLSGMVSVTGGKFTSYRLMAEKTCDHVCALLGVTEPCRTAEESIIPAPSPALLDRAKRLFPAAGLELAVARMGDDLENAVTGAEKDPWKRLILCECELVTMAEFEAVAREQSSSSLNDIRRRTRLGMGTCQGNFCALRATGALTEQNLTWGQGPREVFRQFLEERWHGIRPLLWGNQLREVELERGIYGASLNVDGECGPVSCAPPDDGLGKSVGENLGEGPVAAPSLPSPPAAAAPLPPPVITEGEEPCSYDVIVVGAGFSGLTAALAAVRRGKKTMLINRGGGAIAIGGGTIDLLGYAQGAPVAGDPFGAMQALDADHPYRLLGTDSIREALGFITALADEAGYSYRAYGNGANVWLPTAAGTMKPSWLTSPGMNPEHILRAKSFGVVGITGMKDFSARMVMAGLASCPQFSGRDMAAVTLPSPLGQPESGLRDTTALDLARFLDTPEGVEWLTRALIKEAPGKETILIPSILGTRPDSSLHARLEEATGRHIIELHCPPPSVTGLRLLGILRAALRRTPVSRIENATVTHATVADGRCVALHTAQGGETTRYTAREFIIATGGFFSEGIWAGPEEAREAIFGLPVAMPGKNAGAGTHEASGQVEERSLPRFFGGSRHPFAAAGVAVDSSLRPVSLAGEVLLHNVRFVGRTIGGYDYALEKSGSGVALATGYYAGSRA
ncbi:anaerobic glycerol-3-phosphate dehydrogenase subunit A [Desulfovibrio sp. OttesenSCG-928-I05]|nr:anaerobic glycerol-3-phosphate dehydrogenase subunit A [Desulfovibrio sp. OttesenSCG-928-I05]